MRHRRDDRPDDELLTQAVARLWVAGLTPSWEANRHNEKRRRTSLPGYPFERNHHSVPRISASADALAISLKKRSDPQDWLYTREWQRTRVKLESVEPRRWLVLRDEDDPSGRLLHDLLRRYGDSVHSVVATDHYSCSEEGVTHIDWRDADHYAQVVRELGRAPGSPIAAVHGLALRTSRTSLTSDDHGDRLQSLVYLAQALSDENRRCSTQADPTALVVVTASGYDVLGNEEISPGNAMLVAAARVIGQEIPAVYSRHIDIATSDIGGIDFLTREIANDRANATVALRNGFRWEERFVPLKTGPPTSVIRDRGVYVVLGGTGGLALEAARALSEEANVRIALVSRSVTGEPAESSARPAGVGSAQLNAERIIHEIRQKGSEVFLVAADLREPAQMKDALMRVRDVYGPITGVIHAAGVELDTPVASQTRSRVAEALGARLAGAKIIEELLTTGEMEFGCFFSSLSSILGGRGKLASSSANAFLDAHAQLLVQRGARVTSISWDTWSGTGVATRAAVGSEIDSWWTARLKNAMSPEEGRAVFRRLLSFPAEHVIVSTRHLDAAIEQDRLAAEHERLSSIASAVAESAAQPSSDEQAASGPDGAFSSDSESVTLDQVERHIAMIFGDMLGVVPQSSRDNFFDLGGDSLTAIRAAARIRTFFGVPLSLREFFEHASVQGLGHLVLKELNAATDKRGDMLREIEELSDEGAAAALVAEDENLTNER
jgi:NAD(P)-dependent dehydrogenase (short-subunit alcohol dehydrogenase family)